MLIVLASNQTMIAGPGPTASITTDPVALNGNDRINAIVNTHVIFNIAAPGLAYAIEVSNEGATWIPFGTIGDTMAAGPESWINIGVSWSYFRVVFSLTAAPGVVAGATFDCHAHISKMGA